MKPLETRVSIMIIIEVSMANPNGNPDWDNAPRTLNSDDRGLITPVCIKRRIRDVLEDHDSVCFKELMKTHNADSERFHIMESKMRGYTGIPQHEATKKVIQMAEKSVEEFFNRFYDIRLLGCTLLEVKDKDENGDDKKKKGKKDDKFRCVNTGCLTVSPAISIAPIEIFEATLTKKAPLRDVDQDIAPAAYKCVEHGLYVATLSINPHVAHRTFATQQDVDMLKSVLPHIFQLSAANARPSSSISIVHAWWKEHTNSLGSFNEYEFFNSLKPTLKGDFAPSKSLSDYSIPDGTKFGAIDLMKDLWNQK